MEKAENTISDFARLTLLRLILASRLKPVLVFLVRPHHEWWGYTRVHWLCDVREDRGTQMTKEMKKNMPNPNLPCPPVFWREVGGLTGTLTSGFSPDRRVPCRM